MQMSRAVYLRGPAGDLNSTELEHTQGFYAVSQKAAVKNDCVC